MNDHDANPFEALRLDPQTPAEQAVHHAGALRQRAATEAEVAAIRRAVQALTGRAEERALHELFTHPRPRYHVPVLERLTAAFRRPPQPEPLPAPPCPPLDLAEFAALLRAAAAEAWRPAPLPFENPEQGEPAGEIEAEVAEALWRALLYDPRA
jgi:hypothetical protein